jgi:phosphate transport system permease protein
MTDQRSQAEIVRQSLKRRYRKERRFRAYGVIAIAIALGALLTLFTDIIGKGYTGFMKTTITMDVQLDGEMMYLDDPTDERQIKMADFVEPLVQSLIKEIPGASEENRKQVRELINPYASVELRDALKANPEELQERGVIETSFNDVFFSGGDSRDPSKAGILGAIVGSLLTMFVTLILSFPIGVAAAIYLEEFAPQNKFTDFIEVNINNLAAVPSIIFGLLGLAVFINLLGMPRSVPVVGGLVLTLMTLPTIIISSRAAIKSVPPSIREAAEGIGASKMQVVLHHVLPLAMPGMLTGSIIGMAQALGETAPLLLIGMVAFIVDVPDGFFDSATVLPVQVFLWAGSPELAFIERASAAIMVLLTFLISMNALAIWMRKRLERRW